MARNWTAAQRSAIETKDKTLLVSAAAGSGKTATLIERIIRMITDKKEPADVSRMLIVTFTKAAAGELRERIYSALRDELASEPGNRYLQKQMVLLESAKICTIHSFCLDLIRANFQRLSLSPSFRVADEAEQALLCRSVMNDLIDLTFESPIDPYGKECGMDFSEFIDNFTLSREDKNLCDVFISLYDKLIAYPEGIEILRDSANLLAIKNGTDFFSTPHGEAIRTHLLSFTSYYEKGYGDACGHFASSDSPSAKYLFAFRSDLDFIVRFRRALENGTYKEAKEAMDSFSFERLASVKSEFLCEEDELYKALRAKFKDEIKELKEEFFSLAEERIAEDFAATSRVCSYMYGFMSEFEKNLESEKKRRGVCGFSDLERYALELLYDKDGKKSDVAESVSGSFDYVYIDEYQDVNAVQDKIFRAVSRPDNRFMVGDIKQSIYGFRGAEPAIFAAYRESFPNLSRAKEDSKEAAIFMSENFRCDKNIVGFVNTVSNFTMRHSSVGYMDEDDLVFKKASETGNEKVKFAVYGATPDDKEENGADDDISAEARGVAEEIARLLDGEKKNDGTPIRPCDIAILLQSVKTSGEAFSRALADKGIASSSTSEESDFFDSPEILLMLCLLNTIDNPRRDIYLAGVLRSPLYGFTMDDLVELKSCDDGKMSLYDMLVAYTEQNDFARGRYFLEKLGKYREISEGMSVDKLIWTLYRDTFALSLLARDENGRTVNKKRENLMYLYEYARNFEASSYKGLYNFIRYINSLIEEGKGTLGAPDSESADAVRIMTIHQSKGLEMPVCFVCDTAKKFNAGDLRENLLFDYSLGVATRLRDETGYARYNTLARKAIELKIAEKRDEEYMRVLYVALTRARERLYVTAKTSRDFEKLFASIRLQRAYPCAYTVGSAKSFADWLLPAVGQNGTENCDFFAVASEYKGPLVIEEKEEARPASDAERVKKIGEKIRKKLDFVYPGSDRPKIPAKLSVSRLYPDLLESDVSEMNEEKIELKLSPKFISGGFSARAADRGTATHVFMQFCDFDFLLSHGVREELARLEEKRFISHEIAELVNIGQLEKFAASGFLARMRRAKRIWREFRFNIDLPASMFAVEEETKKKLASESVLVQGVIDCFFEEENGDIILCDYKTDHLTPEELSDRSLAKKKLSYAHGDQLRYYREALFRIFGKDVAHTYIYSLPLGDAVEI